LRVEGSGLRVQGLGFRVQGSGFRIQGSGFRVQGSGCMILERPRSAWEGSALPAPGSQPPVFPATLPEIRGAV